MLAAASKGLQVKLENCEDVPSIRDSAKQEGSVCCRFAFINCAKRGKLVKNVALLNSYLGTLDVVRQTQMEMNEMTERCLVRLQHLSR